MRLHSEKQILFLALAICFVFSVVFSAPIYVDEHDCLIEEEDCLFCLHVDTKKSFFKALKIADVLLSYPVPQFQFLEKTPDCFVNFNLPIEQKTRLNT